MIVLNKNRHSRKPGFKQSFYQKTGFGFYKKNFLLEYFVIRPNNFNRKLRMITGHFLLKFFCIQFYQ